MPRLQHRVYFREEFQICAHGRRLFYNQFILVAEAVVRGYDNLLARLQAFYNFVVLRVLAPYTDTTFSSLRSIGIDHIHPLAAGSLVE